LQSLEPLDLRDQFAPWIPQGDPQSRAEQPRSNSFGIDAQYDDEPSSDNANQSDQSEVSMIPRSSHRSNCCRQHSNGGDPKCELAEGLISPLA
jgi:hypothetical protein